MVKKRPAITGHPENNLMQENKRSDNKNKPAPITLASNLTLAAGAIMGLFTLAKAYLFTEVPPGSCPLTLNRPWLYASLGLLVLSLILSFFEPGKKKQEKE